MKINKLLIFVLIVFLIATVIFVGCNKKSAKKTQEEAITPSGSIIYDNEIAEEKFLKERISDATAIYYKSSANGEFGDDRYLFEKTLLPSAYTELDYIQSTGSQCIDTGIKYSDTLTFDLKFSDYTNAANTGGIFGTEGWMFSLTRYQPTKLIWCTEQKKYFSYNSFSPYKAYTVQCGKEFMTINDTETISVNSSGIFGTQNITLFKSNTGYASVKIYYFKIYDGETILRNYIPCYRNYDKAVGLYDLVSNRFYCNASEYNFENEEIPSTMDLPDNYQEVEYIESTGTQRVKLNLIPKSTYKIESTFAITDLSVNSTIWCARGETQAIDTTTAFYVANEGIRCDFGEIKESYTTGNLVVNSKHTLTMDSNSWYLDGALLTKMEAATFNAGSAIQLFASHYNGIDFDVQNYSKMKLYSFKVYDDNKNLVLEVIPCYRKADSVAGLFDVVRQKFYQNEGTGTFVVGDIVRDSTFPSGYQPIEYISTSGTQFITTDVIGEAIWEYDIKYDLAYVTERQLMGHGGESGEYWGVMDGKYGKAYWNLSDVPIGNRDIVRVENYAESGKVYVNGVFAYDNLYDSRSESKYAQIFAIRGTFGSYCTLYGCKVYSKDETLIRNFVPCYRKSDNVAGLYDLVNNKFYTNEGSGTFGVGNPVDTYDIKDITLPSDYTLATYIQATGTQYIDTGVAPGTSLAFDLTVSDLNDTAYILTQGKYGLRVYENTFKNFVYSKRFTYTSAITSGIQYRIKGSNDYLTVDGTNGIQEADNDTPDGNAVIFASGSSGKLYSCKIWDGSTLVRDLVPCTRNSDSVAGLYDLVNNVFYTNNGTGLFIVGGSSIDNNEIPNTYQRVEYIKSTGTQLIDTNIIPNQDTGIEITFSSSSYANNDLLLFGAGVDNTTNAFELYPWNSEMEFNYGTSAVFSPMSFDSNAIITAYQKKANFGYYVNGRETLSSNHTANTFTSPYTLYLFGLHREEALISTAEIKLYSCKIWDNDVLVRDYIPCYRKLDSVVGLYDKVNDVFYTNFVGDDFSLGELIITANETLPDEYEKVDYLEAFGTGGPSSTGQQIDLGIALDMENDWIEISFQSTKLNQNGMILATQGENNYFWLYNYQIESILALYTGVDGQQLKVGSVNADTKKHSFKWRNKQAILDGVVLGTDERTLPTTDYNVFLYSWGDDYHYSGRIYRCKIWKSGILVRDLVPCYRKADFEPGMYDLVNGVFYTNSGSGTFFAGTSAEALIPGSTILPLKYAEEYDSLKYLTSAGEQYIDTGIIPRTDAILEIAFGTDNLLMTNGYVLGNGSGDGLEIYLDTGVWKIAFGSETVMFEAIPSTKTTLILAQKMVFVGYDDSSPSFVGMFTSTLESTRSLILFGTNRESGIILSSAINIYGFRMLSGNSMCEYLPSIQKETNVYGMYDGVQDKILQSNGTSKFISSQEILAKLLPDEYHILEYVEGFGKQYINTGIADSNNTMYELDSLTTSNTTALGSTTGMTVTHNTNYPGGYFYYYNSSKTGAHGFSTTNKRTLYKQNGNLCYKDDVLVYAYPELTYTNTRTMYLFGRNKAGTLSDSGDTKIYSCKIYQNKLLVRYYIPACRNSDKEIGLYDVVSGTFFTNEGEGSFASNETENAYTGVMLPSGYRQVEYIEGTGTQYFDTGIIINKPDILDYSITIQYNSTTQLWSGATPYLQLSSAIFKTKEKMHININYDGVYEKIYIGDFLAKTNDWTDYDYPNVHVMIFVLGDANETIYHTSPLSAKVYSARLIMNNELVLDCVPCYRESDGEAGFYDLVSQRFIRNSGTGNARVGKEVHNVSNAYEQVDYIEYTGTQQIVIPHNVTSSTKVEVTLANNTDNTNTYSIVDMGDTTLKVINNIPAYNVFDATVTGSAFTTNTLYTLVTSFDKDNALTINEDVLNTESITLGTFANSIRLFGNTDSLHGTIKLYRIKVYEGNTLVYDFIPTVRKHDGKIGLYEYINDDFYIPEEGDLECNVSFEQERTKNLYESLDFVYFDDEHYLDLSYLGNTKFIFDAQFDAELSNGTMGYQKIKDYNWGVKQGKYILGSTEQYTAGNRDIIIDEYTASSIIRSLNGEVVATIPLTANAKGIYRIGNKLDNSMENCCIKIYSIKIEQDGVLIAELVPARRKSDQSLGFLDKVSDVFYVVYNNKNNFVMGNIVGHYFDTNNVVTEVSESHSGDISHICSICGTEIHETQDALAYKVNFTYGTGVKEIRVFKGYDLSSYETIDTAYSRNKNTNNYSRRNGQVYFEIVLDEGYEIEKIYPGDATCTNHENNIYIISDITSETTVKILARKQVQE